MATNINFPAISSPSWPITRIREDNMLRSQMENGIVQTRPKFTRTKDGWELEWKAMSNTDHSTFVTFFETTLSNGALSFNWTHPITNVTKEYRIEAPPEESNYDLTWWTVSFTIKEV